jgi:2,4-dienoyl-CoA reductase-like NADH-dependent reductase (Old Yellow Enzyme family)
MTSPYPHLFAPLALRHLTLKNRIVFGAHTANMSEEGIPGDRHLGYYRERARGGAAMIVVEPVPVHETAVLTRGNFLADSDAIVEPFRRITEEVKSHGTVIVQQLYHVGAHGDWDNSFRESWSPSGLPSMFNSDGSHAMTGAEIEEVIGGHIAAARRAKAAGFDGIEIMAAYSALMEQFWSPFTNRRGDDWGGAFDNRMRFSTRIYDGIRKACGDDFICGLAVSVDPGAAPVQTIEDLEAAVAWHDERALIDYVTVGTGSYWGGSNIIPTAFEQAHSGEAYAARLKAVTRHARVQCEARVKTPDNAERVLAEGSADMVSIVRGQIADPWLADKARRGRAVEIRPCISCNQQCIGRRRRDYWISCLVNPSAGREAEWGGDRFEPAARPRRILVVGGGPAGLEAARVAAERGHRVTLAEADDRLGGQLRLAGEQPMRNEIRDHLAWYDRELDRLGVARRMGAAMDGDAVRQAGADAVVIATGAVPAGTGYQRALPEVDRLPGLELGNAFSVNDVLAGKVEPGPRVLVLDDLGGWPAAGTALKLAEAGHQVTLVTRDAAVAVDAARMGVDKPLRRGLARAGADLRPMSVVTAWRGDGATIRHLPSGAEETKTFDTLLMAGTPVANDGLARELDGGDLELHVIGDCVAHHKASGAIYDGRRVGLVL